MEDAFFLFWGWGGGGGKVGWGYNCTPHLQADILQFLFVFFKDTMKSLVCSSGFSRRIGAGFLQRHEELYE